MIPGTSAVPPRIDAHAHGVPDSASSPDVFRLWNVGVPDGKVPETGFFSAGIHPCDAARYLPAEFARFFASPHCLAVGECGLDRTAEVPFQVQIDTFLAQVICAENLGKPVIIHCVRCAQELLHLKSKLESDTVPWVIHGFRGARRKADAFLDAGCMLSFGAGLLRDAGNLTYFPAIPLDRILVESDESPDLLPQIYAVAASLHLTPPDEFASAIRANFIRIFHYDPA